MKADELKTENTGRPFYSTRLVRAGLWANLTPRAMAVLIVIEAAANKKWLCWVGVEFIAHQAGLPYRRVQECIKELAEKGYIKRYRNGHTMSNGIKVTLTEVIPPELIKSDAQTGARQESIPDARNLTPGCAETDSLMRGKEVSDAQTGAQNQDHYNQDLKTGPSTSSEKPDGDDEIVSGESEEEEKKKNYLTVFNREAGPLDLDIQKEVKSLTLDQSEKLLWNFRTGLNDRIDNPMGLFISKLRKIDILVDVSQDAKMRWAKGPSGGKIFGRVYDLSEVGKYDNVGVTVSNTSVKSQAKIIEEQLNYRNTLVEKYSPEYEQAKPAIQQAMKKLSMKEFENLLRENRQALEADYAEIDLKRLSESDKKDFCYWFSPLILYRYGRGPFKERNYATKK